ncbi:MAG: LamG domain-containing protein [Verrucomicrobiota bacterium]
MKFAYACPAVVAALLLASTMAALASLNDGLALYYSFDENLGGVVADGSGQGVGGLVVGATHVPAGRCGGAYSFDGVDDYIEVSRNPTTSRNYTVSLWFTLASSNHFDGKVLIAYNRRYQIETIFQSNRNCFISYVLSSTLWDNAGAFWRLSDPIALPENEWQHVALVVSDSPTPNLAYYLNGQLHGTGVDGLDVNPGSLRMLIGACNNFPWTSVGYFWRGMIDDVRIYERALAPAEILELAGACPPVPADGEPFIATVGFSNDPEGDQDVTEFYTNETLYVRVNDVDVVAGDPACRIKVTLKQFQKGKVRFELTRNADGSFTGSYPLNVFRPGVIRIDVEGSCVGHDAWIMKRSLLHLNAD